MHVNSPTLTRMMPCAAALAVVLSTGSLPAAAQQSGAPQITEKNAEAIRDHIDEAEDILERLLDWRHAPTAVRRESSDAPPPTEPATTLISVPRADVERLTALLQATASVLPKTDQASSSRGDLGAHVRKAQEIARELMPQSADKPVGTTGAARDATIEVDRTALERLEVEIDAIELVAPRRLQ